MSVNNARKFVVKMREDHNFRNKVFEAHSSEELNSFLHAEGLFFDKSELIVAMAECMQQLELQMSNC